MRRSLQSDRRRLSRLAGQCCPLCHRHGAVGQLLFDGRRLYCLSPWAHSWSNPDAAEAEIAEPKPFGEAYPAGYDAAAEAAALVYQGNLERALGDWMPPEARQE